MNRYFKVTTIAILAVVAFATILFQSSPPVSLAQEPSRRQMEYRDIEIPPAALLTNRGRQLAKELQNLRRALSRLGSKHPTREVIEDQIEAIQKELAAWVPGKAIQGGEDLGENPFDPASNSSPRINQTDLRELVLRMSDRISALEHRVQRLERAR